VLTNKKTNSQIILLAVLLANLIACGGGGTSSSSQPSDTTAPFIVATNPSSEQIDVNTSTAIKVTFNESISDVQVDQVAIFPYDNNDVLSVTSIALQQDPFSYNTQTKTLSIIPEANALQSATRYQVTIRNIKNITGIAMVESCQWEFATVGFPDFGVGNTGVCGYVAAVTEIPGEPQKVKAVAGNASVSISWLAPIASIRADVTYYKLEKSIDNAQSFSDVSIFISATKLSFTDNNALNDTRYIYRVSAGNSIGFSNGVNSNAVTPVSNQASIVPGAPEKVTAVATDTTVSITWSAPITGDAVSFYNVEKSVNGGAYIPVKEKMPAASLSYVDIKTQNNISHIYRVTAGNSIGLGAKSLSNSVMPSVAAAIQARVELTSSVPGVDDKFGRAMVFSPNGNMIAIGEPLSSSGNTGGTANLIAGTVQIFEKSNGNWSLVQVLKAQVRSFGFGFSLAMSQDGSTLAVGASGSNFVEIFIKSNTSWLYSETIVPNNIAVGNFGYAIGFHPNSTILAIGSHSASPNSQASAGLVQLFTRSASIWTLSQTLTSQAPANGNRFGITVNFSPDGSTLAIGEQYGDVSMFDSNEGTVQLFINDGLNWVVNQTLVTNNTWLPFIYRAGNHSIDFSPDSNTLVIGEHTAGNTVHLFTRSGNNWSEGPKLKGTNANLNANFGISVSFSADGNTLAVGEHNGTSNNGAGIGVANAGNVYLYNKSGASWILSRTLTALVPTDKNQFGTSVYFNPVTSELAIGELNGDTATATNAGTVSIIDLLQLP